METLVATPDPDEPWQPLHIVGSTDQFTLTWPPNTTATTTSSASAWSALRTLHTTWATTAGMTWR